MPARKKTATRKPSRNKTATETPKVPTLIPQPNGRGALLSGGMPGNRGGGLQPSEVRRMALDGFAESLPVIRRISRGELTVRLQEKCEKCGHEPEKGLDVRLPELKPGEIVKAGDVLGKYGLGEKDDGSAVRADARGRVRWMLAIIDARPTWTRDELIQGLAPVWDANSAIPPEHREER